MPDVTIAQVQAEMDALKVQIAALQSQPGFWAGLDARITANPKLTAMLSSLLFAALTWATTYFSTPVKEVPGPERVVYKDAPTPGYTKSKEMP